jgi:CRP-like cAMP-binding protein
VKIFAELGDEQIAALLQYIQMLPIRQWAEIVKQGDPGDSMFLILDGEVRVRLMINGKESILATLGVGEFFGEISLFDDGPRSADIIANRDGMLLKVKVDDFRNLASKHPDVAAPLLMAIGRTLTARIRADNKRYRDSISFSRAATTPGMG